MKRSESRRWEGGRILWLHPRLQPWLARLREFQRRRGRDRGGMKIEVFSDDESTARAAAKFVAAEAAAAVAARGQFVMAVSGGRTPWIMLLALGNEEVQWERIHVVQVDERIAPAEHPDRNLAHLRETLLGHSPIRPKQIHAMPVESPDLEAAASQYASTLGKIAGSPPTLDLVHLGLGPDGHTASLVPGDPVLDVNDVDVAVTGVYQGRRRMTLTYPIINRARRILWLLTGKVSALLRLRNADPSIPAGGICQDRAVIFADCSAVGELAAYVAVDWRHSEQINP
jgi:6-phosphogluconolactonase